MCRGRFSYLRRRQRLPQEPWRGSGPTAVESRVDSVGVGQAAKIPPGPPRAACGAGWGVEQGYSLPTSVQAALRGSQRGRIHLISPETRDFQGE